MEEIKVGEYVRTKIGDIYKIQNLNDYDFLRDKFYCLINKHSKNIIDLIIEKELDKIFENTTPKELLQELIECGLEVKEGQDV